MSAPGQGCRCQCICHVHGPKPGHCLNSAAPGQEWCHGCIAAIACDTMAEQRVAYLAAEAEREAAKKARAQA